MERDFKGIWIPKSIWLNNNINVMEKLFLVEIDSLDNENGCFASNDYFSEFFGLSKSRCSEIINGLEKKGFLKIILQRKAGSKAIEKRIIKVFDIPNTYSKNQTDLFEKPKGYSEKAKDNNTLINNKPTNNIKVIYMDLAFIDDSIDRVKITKEQYDKLLNKYGEYQLHKEILDLDNYIVNGKGNKYKDHYRALNTWCNKNSKGESNARGYDKQDNRQKPQYDFSCYE
ncbi:helix-turn-helix domain-containing protein [Clostridium beijerinckii]|uniref:helix-turn-helix domain-containing protein n=1 Tax=Clostridium beijerinckii TaxID=1520 RepID=UPI001F2A0974|nr:helix-turn-helix domain-containing protein [Clostridium beijerinckii]